MSQIKIGVTNGYDVYYDPERKLFLAVDGNGMEVAAESTQEKLETVIKEICKNAIGFPISVIYVRSWTNPVAGRITSYNFSKRFAWFVSDTGHREQVTNSDNLYPYNDANKAVLEKIIELVKRRDEIGEQAIATRKEFTGALTTAFFQERK